MVKPMEEKHSLWVWWGIIIIAAIWIWRDHNEMIRLEQEKTYLEERIEEYRQALEDANNNIEEANSNIEEAKSNAWETYEDMGNALDNIDTVDTISEP